MASDTLEILYRRNLDFVFRICFRYARSKSEAEDLTQETFVKVSRHKQHFRGEAEWSTWIYRVAVNTCLDHLRKLKKERNNLAEYLEEMVVQNLDSGGDRVLAKLELERILGHLRPRLRTILFLTLAEGLSYAEAAQVMKMSESAVSKCVTRFMKKSTAKREIRHGFFLPSRNVVQDA